MGRWCHVLKWLPMLCTFLSVTASVRHPAVELYPNTHYSCCWHVLTAESVLRLRTRHDPKHGIIGPFWFEDENEQPQTVNMERYVAVLRTFLASLGRRRGMDQDQQWFQQDGATPTHQMSPYPGLESDLMTDRSQPEVWCGVGSAFTRLVPPDFNLWGYLKDNVYENNPQTIGELKAAITGRIRQIPQEECVRVIDNFAPRTTFRAHFEKNIKTMQTDSGG